MMRSAGRFGGVIVACGLLLGGCAHLEHQLDAPLPLDELQALSAGTHYGAVLDAFGPPTKMTALQDGMAFLYEHIDLSERQYGLILPGEVGKWIKAVYASADADVEAVMLIFDQQGRLRALDTEHWVADAGAGMSVTLIFSAGSFTDTEQYEQSASTGLDWGSGLLQRPLVLLNSRQSLETGANGVQLTTNSDAAGQHALELKH